MSETISFLTGWAADIRASSGKSVDADSLEEAASIIANQADEITRLREDLAISLSYRDELVSANEGLGVALSEAQQRYKDARRVALGDAAITHETRVTELRNDPSSYKNGKITKSAKRASDFHERSAAVIRALQSEER